MKEFKNSFVSLATLVCSVFLQGSIFFGVWNALAWQFNFAPIGYWTAIGMWYLVKVILAIFKKGE